MLVVDVSGFEGPLDLLLTLSRTQKVDLMQVSVLQLADQYLAFVEQARALRGLAVLQGEEVRDGPLGLDDGQVVHHVHVQEAHRHRDAAALVELGGVVLRV